MFIKLINSAYYAPYQNSVIFFVNLINSKIYVLSPTLKSDLEQLSTGCESDCIDPELSKFLFIEGLLCTIEK